MCFKNIHLFFKDVLRAHCRKSIKHKSFVNNFKQSCLCARSVSRHGYRLRNYPSNHRSTATRFQITCEHASGENEKEVGEGSKTTRAKKRIERSKPASRVGSGLVGSGRVVSCYVVPGRVGEASPTPRKLANAFLPLAGNLFAG